jgi:hypothetical protein
MTLDEGELRQLVSDALVEIEMREMEAKQEDLALASKSHSSE